MQNFRNKKLKPNDALKGVSFFQYNSQAALINVCMPSGKGVVCGMTTLKTKAYNHEFCCQGVTIARQFPPNTTCYIGFCAL